MIQGVKFMEKLLTYNNTDKTSLSYTADRTNADKKNIQTTEEKENTPEDKIALTEPAANIQDTERIKTEARSLLSELKASGGDRMKSEISPGRFKYILLEGNKLIEVIVNKNSPEQARRSIYTLDEAGLKSKEFSYYKGNPPKLISNIGVFMNPDGTNERKIYPAGVNTSWKDIISSTSDILKEPEKKSPAETKETESKDVKSKPEASQTNAENQNNTYDTEEIKQDPIKDNAPPAKDYKTAYFNLYNNTFQISYPPGWVPKINGQGEIVVYKKEDEYTGVQRSIVGGSQNTDPYNLILHATKAIKAKIGDNIKVLDYKKNPPLQTENGPVNTNETTIEFTSNGHIYTAVIEAMVFNRPSDWTGEISIVSCRKDSVSNELPVLQAIHKSFKKVQE